MQWIICCVFTNRETTKHLADWKKSFAWPKIRSESVFQPRHWDLNLDLLGELALTGWLILESPKGSPWSWLLLCWEKCKLEQTDRITGIASPGIYLFNYLFIKRLQWWYCTSRHKQSKAFVLQHGSIFLVSHFSRGLCGASSKLRIVP